MELYIHIPFCRSKCTYCDFASWAGQEHMMDVYVDALLTEAAQRNTHETIETVFIGGGTPSVLPPVLLRRLLHGLREQFSLAPDAEFTTEANPGTLTEEWLTEAVSCGINRISMGMQAYQPALLQKLGRIHSFSQVEDSMRMIRSTGIRETNLDLMFGIPDQSLEMWQETLDAALSLQPTHISCYGLIPEEGTILDAKLKSGAWILPDEDAERQMYDMSISTLVAHGYHQYEISNFARPGSECRHNVGYWQQKPYLGLGASAASMLIDQYHPLAYHRETNPRTIRDYLSLINGEGSIARETDPVSSIDARFETMMLGLRMNSGVREKDFEGKHGIPLREVYGKQLLDLQRRGLVCFLDGSWSLTRHGMDIQNSILLDFMDE